MLVAIHSVRLKIMCFTVLLAMSIASSSEDDLDSSLCQSTYSPSLRSICTEKDDILSGLPCSSKLLSKIQCMNSSVLSLTATKDSWAEVAQSAACEQFESISAQAKEELLDFKTRRLHAFRKSLIELAELEVKHARTQQDLLRKSIQNLKELL